jgi:hypothetical protein
VATVLYDDIDGEKLLPKKRGRFRTFSREALHKFNAKGVESCLTGPNATNTNPKRKRGISWISVVLKSPSLTLRVIVRSGQQP